MLYADINILYFHTSHTLTQSNNQHCINVLSVTNMQRYNFAVINYSMVANGIRYKWNQ